MSPIHIQTKCRVLVAATSLLAAAATFAADDSEQPKWLPIFRDFRVQQAPGQWDVGLSLLAQTDREGPDFAATTNSAVGGGMHATYKIGGMAEIYGVLPFNHESTRARLLGQEGARLHTGIGDLTLGSRALVREESEFIPEITASVEVEFPTGSTRSAYSVNSGLTLTSFYDPVVLLGSVKVNEPVDSAADATIELRGAALLNVSETVVASVEARYSTRANDFGNPNIDTLSFAPSITVTRGRHAFTAELAIGVTKPAPDTAFQFGWSVRY